MSSAQVSVNGIAALLDSGIIDIIMNSLEYSEKVKYSISIEMEVPSYESTRYLPDSLVVRFAKDKPTNKIETDHKLRLFIEVFHALAGIEMYDVKKENLIHELVLTGKFTEQEVLNYIKKAQQNGLVFERKTDMYSLA